MIISKSEVKKAVEKAYYAVSRMLDGEPRASYLFQKSYKSAKSEEKNHRLNRPAPIQSVTTAAQYFAVKWFFDVAPEINNWAYVFEYRDDARYGWAAHASFISRSRGEREALVEATKAMCKNVLALDYRVHIMGKDD